MNDLKTISGLVKAILEEDVQARNSDSYLYLKVLERYSFENEISLHHITVPVFLRRMEQYGFPQFESVRRSRQKVQARCPELAACNRVSALRSENEREYREFARD